MKLKNSKFFIAIFIYFISVKVCHAQTDTTDYAASRWGISTNPSSPVNTQKSSAASYFNWMTPDSGDYMFYYLGSSGHRKVLSPWFETSTDYNYYHIATAASKDYYWEDGWELLKINMGKLADHSTARAIDVTAPYFMLYNKYTGVIRMFATLATPLSSYSAAEVDFIEPVQNIPTSGDNPGLRASAFLGQHGALAQPLDQKTSSSATIVKIPTVYSQSSEDFFWVDLPVEYDPCACRHNSNIQVDFKMVDTGTINLTGTLMQTQHVMNNTATTTNPAKVLGDFAVGILDIGTSLATGTFNFASVTSLINGFTDAGVLTSSQAATLSDVGTFGGLANDFSGLDSGKTLKDSLKSYKTIMSTVNSFYTSNTSKATGTGGANNASASSIAGTMKLSGTMTSLYTYPGGQFTMLTPGSLHSALDNEEINSSTYDSAGNLRAEYPLYNKILGTFALLQTPLINEYDSVWGDNFRNVYAGDGDLLYVDSTIEYRNVYKIAAQPLYALNPIMHADMNRTKIKVALYLQYTGSDPLPYPYAQNINFSRVGTTSHDFISPFVSVDCATDLISDFDFNGSIYSGISSNYKLELRFQIDFVSTDIGHDGKPNTSLITITYPVNITHVYQNPLLTPPLNFADLAIVPQEVYFNSPITFSADTIVRASRNMYINNTITLESGVHVTFLAGKQIKTKDGISLPIGVIQEIGEGFMCSTTDPQQSHGYVMSFCDSGIPGIAYHAHEVALTGPYIAPPKTSLDYGKFDCSIYPNPAHDIATLYLNLPEDAQFNMSIIDITGKEVRRIFNDKTFAAGAFETQFDVSGLNEGMYFCRIYNGYTSQVKKLVIVDK